MELGEIADGQEADSDADRFASESLSSNERFASELQEDRYGQG